MFDVEDARYEQAIPLLQRALAVQPQMPVANLQYGIAQARLKHFDLAIAPLRKAVTAQPDNGMGHYELGLALFETGDWKERRLSSRPPRSARPGGRTRISRWPRSMPASIASPRL